MVTRYDILYVSYVVAFVVVSVAAMALVFYAQSSAAYPARGRCMYDNSNRGVNIYTPSPISWVSFCHSLVVI